MKYNKWTLGLAAVGAVSLASVTQAEESNAVQTMLSSTTLSGYVNTSIHWNPGTGNSSDATVGDLDGSDNSNPLSRVPAYAFNSPGKSDGFNLNVVNLTLEKPLDVQDQWAAGYLIDIIAGPDAVGFNSAGGGGDVGLKQAYVALRAPIGNGLDLKLGTFDTIIGYEVFHGGSNPNYTRSWGYTIEPTQHTGVLASYRVNDIVGFSFGVANTWDPGINTRSGIESSKTYMASVTVTAPEDAGVLAGSTLYAGIVNGLPGGHRSDRITSYYTGGTLATPIQGLNVGMALDHVTRGDSGEANRDHATAVGLYASFAATEKLTLHTRGEWA
ncbi:MAG TPA: outer membrane beta-barrel protein, partial [Methylomirabilota bacterium]|nr:outer membrane beta-barrel protein [Methylomirabilota bacterium]